MQTPSSAGKVRRATVRLLLRGSRIPVVRPVAELGMRALFNGLAPRWERIRAHPTYRAGMRHAFEQLPEGFEPAHVLDVACGTGIAAELTRERWPRADVLGCDISPRMVELARELVPGARFEISSARHLPAADDSIDLLTTLDGVVDASEFARVLAPGGQVLVVYSLAGTTPISRPLDEVAADLASTGLDSEAYVDGPAQVLRASAR